MPRGYRLCECGKHQRLNFETHSEHFERIERERDQATFRGVPVFRSGDGLVAAEPGFRPFGDRLTTVKRTFATTIGKV